MLGGAAKKPDPVSVVTAVRGGVAAAIFSFSYPDNRSATMTVAKKSVRSDTARRKGPCKMVVRQEGTPSTQL